MELSQNQLGQMSYSQARKAMQGEAGSVDAYINQSDSAFNLAKAKRTGEVSLQSGYTVWDVSEAVYRANNGIGKDVLLDNNAQAQEEVGKIFETIVQANEHITFENFSSLQAGTSVDLADTLKEYVATLGEADDQDRYRLATGEDKAAILGKTRNLLNIPEGVTVTDQELENAMRAQQGIADDGNMAGGILEVAPLRESIERLVSEKQRIEQERQERLAEEQRQAEIEAARVARNETVSGALGNYWQGENSNEFANFNNGERGFDQENIAKVEDFANQLMEGKETLNREEFRQSAAIRGFVGENYNFNEIADGIFDDLSGLDGSSETVSKPEMAAWVMMMDHADQGVGGMPFDSSISQRGLRSIQQAYENRQPGQEATIHTGMGGEIPIGSRLKGLYGQYWHYVNEQRGLNSGDLGQVSADSLRRPRLQEGISAQEAVSTVRQLVNPDSKYTDADIQGGLTAYATEKNNGSLGRLQINNSELLEAIEKSWLDRQRTEYVAGLSETETEAKAVYDRLSTDNGQHEFFGRRIMQDGERPEEYYQRAEELARVLSTGQGTDPVKGDTFTERPAGADGMTLQEFKGSTFAAILKQQGIDEGRLDEIFNQLASADGNTDRASMAELTSFTLFLDNMSNEGGLNAQAGTIHANDLRGLRRMRNTDERIQGEYQKYFAYKNPDQVDSSSQVAAQAMATPSQTSISYGNMRNYAPGETDASTPGAFSKALDYAKAFIGKMDTDRNGTLSKEEFTTNQPSFPMAGILYGGSRDKLFDAIARADREIDAVEFAAWNMHTDRRGRFDGMISEQEVTDARIEAEETPDQFRSAFNQQVGQVEGFTGSSDPGAMYRQVARHDGMNFFSEGQVQWMGSGRDITADYTRHTMDLAQYIIGQEGADGGMNRDQFRNSQFGRLLHDSGMNDQTVDAVFNAMDNLNPNNAGTIGSDELAAFLIHVDKIDTGWGRRGDGGIIPGDGQITMQKLRSLNADFENRLFPRRPEVLDGPLRGTYEGLHPSLEIPEVQEETKSLWQRLFGG